MEELKLSQEEEAKKILEGLQYEDISAQIN